MLSESEIIEYKKKYAVLLEKVRTEYNFVNTELLFLNGKVTDRASILQRATRSYKVLIRSLEYLMEFADAQTVVIKENLSAIFNRTDHLDSPEELEARFNTIKKSYAGYNKNQQPAKTSPTDNNYNYSKNILKMREQFTERVPARQSQPKPEPELMLYKTKDIKRLGDLAKEYTKKISQKLKEDTTYQEELGNLANNMIQFQNECLKAINQNKKWGFIKKEKTKFDMNLIANFYNELDKAKVFGIEIKKSGAEQVIPVKSEIQNDKSTRKNNSGQGDVANKIKRQPPVKIKEVDQSEKNESNGKNEGYFAKRTEKAKKMINSVLEPVAEAVMGYVSDKNIHEINHKVEIIGQKLDALKVGLRDENLSDNNLLRIRLQSSERQLNELTKQLRSYSDYDGIHASRPGMSKLIAKNFTKLDKLTQKLEVDVYSHMIDRAMEELVSSRNDLRGDYNQILQYTEVLDASTTSAEKKELTKGILENYSKQRAVKRQSLDSINLAPKHVIVDTIPTLGNIQSKLNSDDDVLGNYACAKVEKNKTNPSISVLKRYLELIKQAIPRSNKDMVEEVLVVKQEISAEVIPELVLENLAQSDLTVPLDHQEESEVPATASQPSSLDRIEESKNNLKKTPPAEPKKISDREQLLAQIRSKASVLKEVEPNSQLPSNDVSAFERGFANNQNGLNYNRLNAEENGTNGTADNLVENGEWGDDAEQGTDSAPRVQQFSTTANGEQSNSVEQDEREASEMPELKAKEQAERAAREKAERTVREETEPKAKRLSTNINTQVARDELSKRFQNRSPGTNAQNLTEDSLSDSASKAREIMDKKRIKLKALQDKKNRENNVTVVTPTVPTQQRQNISDLSASNPESLVSTDGLANPKNGSLNQREAFSNANNDRNGANKSKAQKRDKALSKKRTIDKSSWNLNEKSIYVADLLNRHKDHPDFNSLKKLSQDLNYFKNDIDNAKKSRKLKTETLVKEYNKLNSSYESITDKFLLPIEQNQQQPESTPINEIQTTGEQNNPVGGLNNQDFNESRVVENQPTSPSVNSSPPLATASSLEPSLRVTAQDSSASANLKVQPQNFQATGSTGKGIKAKLEALRNSGKPVQQNDIVQGTPGRVEALIRQFNSANIPASSVPRTTEGNSQEENTKVNIPGITRNPVDPHILEIINQLYPRQGIPVPQSGNNSEPRGDHTQTSPPSDINNTNVQETETPITEASGANAGPETVDQGDSSSAGSSTPELASSPNPHLHGVAPIEQVVSNPVIDPLATLTTGDTSLNNIPSTQVNTAHRGGIPYLVQAFIKNEERGESGDVLIKQPSEDELNKKHEVETTLDDAQGQKIKFTQEITETKHAEGHSSYRSVFTLNKPTSGDLSPENKGKALAQMVAAYMASNKMQPGKKLKLTVYNEADRAIAFQVLEGYFGNNWQDKVSVVDKEDQPVVATASRSSAEARSEVGSNSESLSEVNTFIHKQKERTVYIARKHEFKYSTQNVLADTSASVAEESESRQRSQSKKVRIYNETMPKKCETLLSEDHILYSETLQDRLDDNLKRFKGLKKSNEATNQKLPTSSPSSNSSTPPADDRENRLRQ